MTRLSFTAASNGSAKAVPPRSASTPAAIASVAAPLAVICNALPAGEAVDRVEVGDDEPVKVPFASEQIGQQGLVGTAGDAVDFVVGSS